MAAKSGRNKFLQKAPTRLCRYPMGQKFCPLFSFYAEIQDGQQKWRENNFGENSPVISADMLRVKNFAERSPVECSYTVWVKNFVEIAPALSVSEINAFLHFTQKLRLAANSGQKVASRPCIYPVGQIFCQNCSLLLRFQDKCIFAVYAEIHDGPQK